MSTVDIWMNDIFGQAVSFEVIFSPEDTPFLNGSAVAVSGARSVRLDAGGNGSVTLLPGRYTVRFSGIANNTDTLLILVPDDEAAYELPALVTAGDWILPFRDFLQCAKNLADVAAPAAAFAAIKQAATAEASGVVQLASQAEVDAGASDTKAVTPATLAGAMKNRFSGEAYEIHSAAFIATADGAYALDTSAGSFDVTIDAALPVGKYIDFADARGTWNTNPPTFLRNDHLIEGAEVNYVDAAQGTFLRILNVGGTTGLRILESGAKPHILVAPVITGQYIGSKFTTTDGTWMGSTASFIYQWQSSADGATWTDITGATADSFVPTSDLLGDFLRVLVSAANVNGSSLPVPSNASTALVAAAFPAGPCQYWKLDETNGARMDATGNGWDLSDINGVGYAAGKIGNAASFDGTNYLTASNVLWPTGVNSTLAAWISIPAAPALFRIVGDGYTNLLSMTAYAGNPESNFNACAGMNKVATTVPTDGTWFHCAVTYNASTDTAEVFINGVSIGTASGNGALPEYGDLNYPFTIGGSNVASDQYFVGLVDEVGVWPRVLTPTEIAQLAAATPFAA